jgi:hypothetical protein
MFKIINKTVEQRFNVMLICLSGKYGREMYDFMAQCNEALWRKGGMLVH